MNSVTAVRRLKLFRGLNYRSVKIRINAYQKVFQIGITEDIAVLSAMLLLSLSKNRDMSM